MNFELLSEISDVETFARGIRVRIRLYLNAQHAGGRKVRWRKRKGFATVRYVNGAIYYAEVHWYEGHGIGIVDLDVKHRIRRIA